MIYKTLAQTCPHEVIFEIIKKKFKDHIFRGRNVVYIPEKIFSSSSNYNRMEWCN